MITIDSRIRDMFYREAKSILKTISIHDFRNIFYNFEQILQYDENLPEFEGLHERLVTSLTIIATGKIDREDIIINFPIIWCKFEPFCKKTLYLIDREKYLALSASDGSLVDYLQAIGFPVFIEKNNRNAQTEAIFKTYLLRNNESHRCEKWSTCDFYRKLAHTLAAFVLVTQKAMPLLKNTKNNIFNRVFTQQCLSFFPPIIYSREFFRLKDFNTFFKTVTIKTNTVDHILEFNDDGWISSWESHSLNNNDVEPINIDNYEYIKETPSKTKRIIHSSHNDFYTSWDIITVNEDGHLNTFEEYGNNSSPYDKLYGDHLIGKIEVVYCTDGGLNIISKSNQIKRKPDVFQVKTKEDLFLDERTKVFIFNSFGFLTEVLYNGNVIRKYEYNDSGILTKIIYRDSTTLDVKMNHNELLFYKNILGADDILVKKIIYENDSIQKIIIYNEKKTPGNHSSITAHSIFFAQ